MEFKPLKNIESSFRQIRLFGRRLELVLCADNNGWTIDKGFTHR